MILTCTHLNKSFGEHQVLRDVSLTIDHREKAALVGINGAGKSTLLKILTGEYVPDSGEVSISKNTRTGYLSQERALESSMTLYEAVSEAKSSLILMENQLRVLEKQMQDAGSHQETIIEKYDSLSSEFDMLGGYSYKSLIGGVLNGLGFSREEYSRPVHSLSSGQKTRVYLGRLLMESPDLLILDEPTNHLDLRSISWLEGYLQGYPGALLLVSHDRFFLNKIVDRVMDLENGSIQCYKGNYNDYALKKKHIRESQVRQYLNQQKEIKHQEAVIEKLRSFNREKSIKRAESRQKLLDKTERLEKPDVPDDKMKILLAPSHPSGRDVLSIRDLGKSYGEKTLFCHFNFEIKKGQHIAIIGDNGTGKSTLLNIINQKIEADTGDIDYGANVTIGYFDQEHHSLTMNKTLFEELSDTYPQMGHTKLRNTLAAFLFTGDDIHKKVSSLSGGERSRLCLAKLMLSNANFIILDEPTNHLDMLSCEILETAIKDYTGTILYVSHDRYFINQTADLILCLANKSFIQYYGNYDYYLEKVKESAFAPPEVRTVPRISSSREEWLQKKEKESQKRKKQTQLAEVESHINAMEAKIAKMDEMMLEEDVYTDPEKCRELVAEKNKLEKKLDESYSQWEILESIPE